MSKLTNAFKTVSSRPRNSLSNGEPFPQGVIDRVWDQAVKAMEKHPLVKSISKTVVPGIKQGTHVIDDYGHVVCKSEFGNISKYGWEIDHIHPVEKAGSYKNSASIDDFENLRVLHWKSNERKSVNDARIYELEYEHIILNKAC